MVIRPEPPGSAGVREEPDLLAQLALDSFVRPDTEALEQRLVPEAAIRAFRFRVDVHHALDRIERSVESFAQLLRVGLGTAQGCLRSVYFGRNLLLLGLEQIGRQGVRVEGFEELVALRVERLQFPSDATHLALVQLSHAAERLVDRFANVLKVEGPIGC